MKKATSLIFCLLFALGVLVMGTPMQAAGDNISVEKIVTSTGVEQREPVGENKEFEASAGKVYCWTKIIAKTPPAKVNHIWYVGGKKVFEQSLELKNPSNRTWSCKSVKVGDWKVEVADEGGTVLSTVEFKVK